MRNAFEEAKGTIERGIRESQARTESAKRDGGNLVAGLFLALAASVGLCLLLAIPGLSAGSAVAGASFAFASSMAAGQIRAWFRR